MCRRYELIRVHPLGIMDLFIRLQTHKAILNRRAHKHTPSPVIHGPLGSSSLVALLSNGTSLVPKLEHKQTQSA